MSHPAPVAFPPVAEQLAVIRRGIEKIVPEADLAARLEWSRSTGRPLRIKYGIDPTGIDLHLGHTVPLRKLRQFQELGHQAVVIIGNYTALVGDPSGRDQARARITAEQVERNARDYLTQIRKVVDVDRAEVHPNGDWFGRMTFADLLELTSKVTVAQLLSRDDFAKRFATAVPIQLHECLYPVMQAFDSVVIESDVELGGTEQLYSFMLARDLQRDPGACALAARLRSDRLHDVLAAARGPGRTVAAEQVGVMSPILVGLDGVRRMGKSLGNYVGIAEEPYEVTKKVMQIPDAMMRSWFELLTDLPTDRIDALLAGHPKEAKRELGRLLVDEFHPPGSGTEAAARWQREIGERTLPELSEIPVAVIDPASLVGPDGRAACGTDDAGRPVLRAVDLLHAAGLCASKSLARQVIDQGGAHFGSPESRTKIAKFDEPVVVTQDLLIWAGKKKLVRLRIPSDG